MKKYGLSTLLIAIAITAAAQNALDLGSRAILRQHQTLSIAPNNAHLKALNQFDIPSNHVTGLIKLAANTTPEELEAEGVNIVRMRGDIALVSMPIDRVEQIASLKQIKTLQLSRKILPKMDKVRQAMGVDKIHSGIDLPQAYTGKGVVAGLVDQGIDPNHVNFRNADGTSRIKQLTHIYLTSANRDGYDVVPYYPETIDQFTTDYADTYHGSHTLGIMGGSYRGEMTVAKGTNISNAVVETDENPYYGNAYEADLAVSCGDLNDMLIALGVEGILDYAYRTEQPAVINLSLGSNIGPHDGSEVMSQYLDLAAKEAIICIAAGNEGDMPIALNRTLTADDLDVKSFLKPIYSEFEAPSYGTFTNLRYDQLYIYSDDASEFTVKVVVYNQDRGTVIFQHAITENMNGGAVYYSTPGYAQEGYLSNANFTKAFSGYIGIGSAIDKNNGRYYALIDYFLSDNTETNSKGNYILGFIVEGKDGQRIDCYCSGLYTTIDSYNQPGWDNGSCNGSISDMACAKNILAVGSYNTRNEWVSLDGLAYNYAGQYTPGEISDFSSYGTLIDGRNLPHVCAPGATTISSTNSYFIEDYEIAQNALQGQLDEESRSNYWQQELGTSMATPAVAGAIALWLEADPTLTIDDVKDIIATTATKDSFVESGDPVQWGAGKFDAYAGLKEVIRRAESNGIENISANTDARLIVTPVGHNNFEVFLGGEKSLNIIIYNMAGQPIKTQSCPGDEATVNASDLNSGIYILSVNERHHHRILIK